MLLCQSEIVHSVTTKIHLWSSFLKLALFK